MMPFWSLHLNYWVIVNYYYRLYMAQILWLISAYVLVRLRTIAMTMKSTLKVADCLYSIGKAIVTENDLRAAASHIQSLSRLQVAMQSVMFYLATDFGD